MFQPSGPTSSLQIHEFTPFLTIHLQIPDSFFVVDHYFIKNSAGTGISPKFATIANGGASFIVGSKVAGIPASDPANIDWLQLANVQGTPRASGLIAALIDLGAEHIGCIGR